ncbi:MAG: hypothetical protein ACQCN3_12450 [Candidatus Bathyarchaeia archaeon]|jgi:hypothetical protein
MAGLVAENTGVAEDDVRLGESATAIAAGASSQILKAVYVRYKDHAFFKNVQAPAAEAIIRETLGWIKKENDEVMLIECDRPLLQGYSGFNGVVVLKSCIISMVPLNFEHILNCQSPVIRNRVRASSQRSEKLSPKNPQEGQKC